MLDYEIDYYLPCPKCGNDYTHYRNCTCLWCDDGYINRYEEDPLWYDPDDFEECQECHGTGIER